MDWCHIDISEELGRYVATERGMGAQSLRRDRDLDRARLLRSDRAGRTLGRYVATELWLELGRYLTTEQDGR
ncbi:hypothetical protein DY000_02060455 [Brassica cretica]|uniref:Uncharacterized protein n=1 Tax=Brassica cretica TaxID=69181 RepID=A0ABQ7AZA8_BRACR|nr:hypothetical protein DY000_02060455 [Brassica cretica]